MKSGFSILEIVIALALLGIVVTGVVSALCMSDYWVWSSEVVSGAMSLTTKQVAGLERQAHLDFFGVTSTPPQVVRGADSPFGVLCASGGFCYTTDTAVVDVSSCLKVAAVASRWRLGLRYATSSFTQSHSLFNRSEVIRRGGDCLLSPLETDWERIAPQRQTTVTTAPAFSTGSDALGERIYVVASSAPQLRIYTRPEQGSETPTLVGASSVLGNRLNAIDVIRDVTTGRVYAFVMQHTRTNQLVVLDVTSDDISVVATRSLIGTDSLGSFPQGWRLVAYGGRLYVLTRETAGAELHIFNIQNPTVPLQITAASVNLARTVNELVVQEQIIGGVTRRYVLLAASAALKELGVYEVTSDIPIERVAVDLPGTENALAVFLSGNTVFVGRQSGSSPELYQFDWLALLSGNTVPTARAEVGADVEALRVVGAVAILGTSKTNAELQVWQVSPDTWNAAVLNAGRISAGSAPRLAPLGLEVGWPNVYTFSQSATQPEQLSVWNTP